MTAKVEIYTSPFCGYCYRAKQLLERKGVEFTEFDVLADSDRREEMTRRTQGQTTVPQIFIGDAHVGGCDELYALERADRLDSLLTGAA